MFDLPNYGRTVEDILASIDDGRRLMPLAPTGPANGAGLARLREASHSDILNGQETSSRAFADCARSALYLYFSALDESHTISQDISSATGSLLHGIMHRQEPDYSNAKYWFRRTGEHELYPTLREEALRLRLRDEGLQQEMRERPRWDPLWFVDCCEAGRAESDLLEIQRLEWQLIFDYSYRKALVG